MKRQRYIVERSAQQDAPWTPVPMEPVTKHRADSYAQMLAINCHGASGHRPRFRVAKVGG